MSNNGYLGLPGRVALKNDVFSIIETEPECPFSSFLVPVKMGSDPKATPL
jgi:hypothetical protein